ncbi:MAG TPA: helix-turn-helix domain-containing protein [Stellaceae bacterium]|nr:helix-turn-helix domain-containing protein [Stellaceae bacterium]
MTDTGHHLSRFSVAIQARTHPAHLVRPCNTCAARSFSACAPLNAAEQKRLVAIMKTVDIAARQAIFDEGDPAENVYNVNAGAVKIYKLLPDGRRQITGFLFAGDFLGLTYNDAYAYSAEALAQSRLCCFPRRKLEAMLEEMPRLEQRLLGMASHELASAQDQMMLLGRKSARERVASFILMLSDAASRRGQRVDTVFLPMRRSDIADYLGLTTETVSRTLTRLRAQGLIEFVNDKQIRLSNPEALAEVAGGCSTDFEK